MYNTYPKIRELNRSVRPEHEVGTILDPGIKIKEHMFKTYLCIVNNANILGIYCQLNISKNCVYIDLLEHIITIQFSKENLVLWDSIIQWQLPGLAVLKFGLNVVLSSPLFFQPN